MAYLFTVTVLALSIQAQPSSSAKLHEAIALQVALDRAGFSSGVIDGRPGSNTRAAQEAYRKQNGRDIAPFPDPLLRYQITTDDATGPFAERIPSDLMEQSKLPALRYQSAEEALAERFHTTPQVLRMLNPSAAFAAGTTIMVPNVDPMVLPKAPEPAAPDAAKPRPTGTSGKDSVVVTVSRSSSALTVTRGDGRVVLFVPVTTGSQHDPLPIGEWKVNGVQYNPTFRYNPDLFWDADPTHSKAKIPPGPNNPVGLVWIDISKEHYGLHGTPEPSQIGRTESHGCVRLTNWDVVRLAALVGPGTVVRFTE
jgi:lipoprotein-anchoring transpeptidase ErfK/SrfK